MSGDEPGRTARLTLVKVLVTLEFTMWGIAVRHLLKHFKIGMILLAVTVALSLGWSYLSHVWFAVIVSCTGCAAFLGLANRDAWRQTGLADPPAARAAQAPARGRRSPKAQARTRKRGELLHPDATVTLSDERAETGVDDVFATLEP